MRDYSCQTTCACAWMSVCVHLQVPVRPCLWVHVRMCPHVYPCACTRQHFLWPLVIRICSHFHGRSLKFLLKIPASFKSTMIFPFILMSATAKLWANWVIKLGRNKLLAQAAWQLMHWGVFQPIQSYIYHVYLARPPHLGDISTINGRFAFKLPELQLQVTTPTSPGCRWGVMPHAESAKLPSPTGGAEGHGEAFKCFIFPHKSAGRNELHPAACLPHVCLISLSACIPLCLLCLPWSQYWITFALNHILTPGNILHLIICQQHFNATIPREIVLEALTSISTLLFMCCHIYFLGK